MPAQPGQVKSQTQARWMHYAEGQGIIKRGTTSNWQAAAPTPFHELPSRIGARPGMPGGLRSSAPRAFRGRNMGVPRNIAARKPRLRSGPVKVVTRKVGPRS